MNLNGRLSYEGNVSGNLGPELVADVEANPSGPATQTLVKIRVGDVIYSIPTGGGGGGVTSYSLLTDKPKINNHTIDGDMTAADLDLQDKIVFPEDGSKYLDGNGEFSTPILSVVYSTEERIIGSWIDGKTLYQKTYSFSNVTITSGGSVTIATLMQEIIVNGYGYIVEGETKYIIPDIALRIKQESSSVKLMASIGASWNISEGSLTIQYTKITD